MDDETGSPSRVEVREALGSLLRDEILFDAFCLDYFPDVHRRFAHGMDRVARETLLLQHASAAEILAKLGGRTAGADPAGLPPNNLPLRNPNFVGRKDALVALHRQLGATSRASVVPSAVFGLGGLGKSSLALEYAHRHAADYTGGLWWVRAEGGPVEALLALAADLRDAGPDPVRRVLARIPEQAPTEGVARAVILALHNHPAPTLLILDNVASAAWRDHLPGGSVRVLVTTRDRTLLPSAAAVALEVLSDAEARELAEQLAGPVADAAEGAARDRVLRLALGDLPVAVEVAARAVAQWRLSWSAYERLLAERPVELLEDEGVRSAYPRGVFAALDLSIERAGSGTPARRLLEGAAVFSPDAIPREWAEQAAGLSDELAVHRGLGALEALGLLKVDADRAQFSLHRLVRQRVRAHAERAGAGEGHRATDPDVSDGGWDGTRRRGIACVREWMRATVDRGRIAAVDARRAHVEEVLAAAESLEPRAWSDLGSRLARHLWHRADYQAARALLERALQADEAALGPGHHSVAALLSSLAVVLQELGDAAGARPLLERALRIDEAALGPEHPNVANDLSNLALVLQDLGDAAGARPLLERALRIDEAALGSDHINVATRLSNLAVVLKNLGDAAGARPLLERALRTLEAVRGTAHPDLATGLSSLALVRYDLGDAAGARLLLERALRISEAALGPEHPDLARRLSNLAVVLQDLGEAADARTLMERALRIDEATLGPEHPALATPLSNLGRVLYELDDAPGARLMLERALRIDEMHGINRPDVATRLYNLAVMLQELGEDPTVRRLMERALAILQSQLGPDHFQTQLVRRSLAALPNVSGTGIR